jgi:MoaA/NifB/PqqE/SkfB family radical SAM enzyme
LETWEAKSVLDQAKRLGILQIAFSGGEPLLREDIVELVQYAHDLGLITRLSTNGLLLDHERVSELKRAGLTLCGVSIDDADPQTHDTLRGVPGAHAKVMEGIRNLREFKIPCEILTYAAKSNVKSGMERIITLGKRIGVQSVYVFFPVAVGCWDRAFDRLLTEEEKTELRKFHQVTFVHVEIPTPHSMCCVLQKSVVYVSPYGDVTPCPFIPYIIGNVRSHTLDYLWQQYSAELNIECRGDCVMNEVKSREALEKHVESVALNVGL